MKKISSILLAIAMLVVSLIPMLAIGVSAAADGDVIASHTANAAFKSYYYSSDAAAIAGGAIAKVGVTGVDGITVAYFKDIGAMGGFGNSTISGGKYGGDFYLLSPTLTNLGSNGNIDHGGRTLSINGYVGADGIANTADDGTSITSTVRLTITGNANVNFTLNNVHLTSSASNGVLQLGSDSKTDSMLTLNNSSLISTAHMANGVVINNGDIVLNSGSLIKSAINSTDNTVNSGVRLHKAVASVTVNEGATIDTNGACITDKAAGSTTVINGGTLISHQRSVYASGNNSPLTVNGGTLTSEANQPTIISKGQTTIGACEIVSKGSNAIHSTGSLTIKDGAVVKNYYKTGRAVFATSSANVTIDGGDFYSSGIAVVHAENNAKITINGGTFWSDRSINALVIAGSGSQPGGVITVNGGDFYCTAGADSTVFRKNESKADDAGVTTHDIVVNKYDSIVGCTNIYVEGPSGVDTKLIATPDMVDGASVRTVKEEAGIRFQSTLNKSVIDNLTANATNVEFGTIIVPLDYLDDTNGVFTVEALTAAGRTYLKIKAANGINVDDEGNYVINAAMINIKPNNIAREFVAIAYLTYTMGGNAYTVYGAYDPDNARSIREVANRTLADVVADGDILVADDPETEDVNEQVVVDAAWREANGYVNPVESWHVFDEETLIWKHVEGTGKYSKYDPDQLDVVKTYVPY